MILAIDTASKTATVAIVEQEKIIAEFSVLSEKTHSKAVLPMIEALFYSTGRNIRDVEYIACCAGPGSFTGLRIGAAVAKSIAFTAGKKIVPVSSLDALAYNAFVEGYILCPMIDARGGHVYTAFYKYEGGRLIRLIDYATVQIGRVLAAGAEYGAPLYFIGSGAMSLAKELSGNGLVAPAHINIHKAGTMGVYAHTHLDFAAAVNGSDFSPVYMSRAQAEGTDE